MRGQSKGGWGGAGEGPWLELGQTAVGRLQAVLMAQKCTRPARRRPGPRCPDPPPAPDRLPHQELRGCLPSPLLPHNGPPLPRTQAYPRPPHHSLAFPQRLMKHRPGKKKINSHLGAGGGGVSAH